MTQPSSPEYVIISTSLRSASLSRIMAKILSEEYSKLGLSHHQIHLSDFPLPLCDGGAAYEHPNVTALTSQIQPARVIIVATPIYNYDANAATKNLIELTGGAWENKVVGFLCAAGGALSYMSIMSLANSLMLDFRCLIIPRFVYAKGDDFIEYTHPTPGLSERIVELAKASTKVRNG